MNMHSPDEWKGLEGFVDNLRRLEAPSAAHETFSVSARSKRSGARAGIRWQAGMVVTGLAALALAYVAMPAFMDESDRVPAATSTSRTAVAAPSTSDPRQALSALLSPWPTNAYAQVPGKPRAVPYPPIAGVDPSRLHPGRRTYIRLSASDYHTSLPHEAWTTVLDTARYRGVLTWRLARRIDRTNNAGADASTDDTLWLRASDLRPIARRVRHTASMAVSQVFTDTSMMELDSILIPLGKIKLRPSMYAWTHRSSFRTETPYVVSMDMLRILLRTVPLSEGWRASVQVGTNQYNARPNPAGYVNLRVAGVDTVQLFSGRFPCWRVVIETGATPETWCVSQETGETLTTEGPFDQSYPESRSVLLYGLQETVRVAPVRRR